MLFLQEQTFPDGYAYVIYNIQMLLLLNHLSRKYPELFGRDQFLQEFLGSCTQCIQDKALVSTQGAKLR